MSLGDDLREDVMTHQVEDKCDQGIPRTNDDAPPLPFALLRSNKSKRERQPQHLEAIYDMGHAGLTLSPEAFHLPLTLGDEMWEDVTSHEVEREWAKEIPGTKNAPPLPLGLLHSHESEWAGKPQPPEPFYHVDLIGPEDAAQPAPDGRASSSSSCDGLWLPAGHGNGAEGGEVPAALCFPGGPQQPGCAAAARALDLQQNSQAVPEDRARSLKPALIRELRARATRSDQPGGQLQVMQAIMRAYASAGKVAMAEHCLSLMIDFGMNPSCTCYSFLVQACAQAGDIERAEEWLREIDNVGMVLGESAYNEVISVHARKGRVDRAEGWLTFMLNSNHGLKPGITSYNAVIHAHARQGNVDRAEHWLRQMVEAKVMPSKVTLASVINACAEAGNRAKAEWWLEVMSKETSMQPNDFSYNTVIKACVKTGDMAKAKAYMNRMREQGLAPTSVTYNLIIHASAQAGDISRAEAYLKEMIQNDCEANHITYNSIINACATKGEVQRAEMWREHMISRGLAPDIVTYGVLCKAYARYGNYAEVARIIAGLGAEGLKPNEYFYASLIGACARARPPQPMAAERAFLECLRLGLSGSTVVKVLRRAVGRPRASQLCQSLGVDPAPSSTKRGPRQQRPSGSGS